MQVKHTIISLGGGVPINRLLPMPLTDRTQFERVMGQLKQYVESGPCPKDVWRAPPEISVLLMPFSNSAKDDLFEAIKIIEAALFGNWLMRLKALNPKLNVESQEKPGVFEYLYPNKEDFEPSNYAETLRIGNEVADKLTRIDLVRNRLRRLEYSDTHNWLSSFLVYTVGVTSLELDKKGKAA